MTKVDLDLFVHTSGINFASTEAKAEYREGILFDIIKELEHKNENARQRYEAITFQLEDCSKMTTIQELDEQKTCKTCAKKLGCDMAQKSKDMFGTKLYEQWFNCYIEENK